jgi:hypothetical protein
MQKRDDYPAWQDKIFQELREHEDTENEPVRAAKERIWRRLFKPLGLTYDEAMGLRQPGMTDREWWTAVEAAASTKTKHS